MKYSITADINANLKKLKRLEQQALIEIYQIGIETPSPKTKKILPTAVSNHVVFGQAVFGSEESSITFEKIKTLVGKNNIKDAMHLSNHIRDKRDYFVTEDKDILKARQQLKQYFPGLKIRTSNELLTELSKL